MGKVRAWKPNFHYYEELMSIECARSMDVDLLIDALWTPELRTCPHEIISNSIIVPKAAVHFLPLQDIKHTKVELRGTESLNEPVLRELHNRFNARGKTKKPHYYTCGNGSQRTCVRYLVSLETVISVEKELKASLITKKLVPLLKRGKQNSVRNN